MPVATASRIAPPTSLTAFVFVQLLGLAGVVLLASVVPLIVWRRGALTGVDQTGPSVPLLWLAVPVAVALVASYCFSVLINRRFVDALVAVERDKK